MREAYVFDAVRTPRGRGRVDGGLHSVPPVRLAATVLEALRRRNGFASADIEDVLLGVVTATGEQGADLARLAVLEAGWDPVVPGVQLSRFCASGLEAIDLAAAKIRAGFADLVVAGGVESMSRVPMGSDGGGWFDDPSTTGYIPQGISADLLASVDGYSRSRLDEYAALSQQRAAQAAADGRFDRSLIPVERATHDAPLERDEAIRPQTTVETLAGLPPAFAELGATRLDRPSGSDGVEPNGAGTLDEAAVRHCPQLDTPAQLQHLHTAGSSSQIVDGAAAVLIGTATAGQRLGLTPRARIAGTAVVGTDPTLMLTGPAPATLRALERLALPVSAVDLFEVNEAFAAVVLRFLRDLDPHDHHLFERVNVNGGAIALGHPLGATGAMLLGTLLDELERRDVHRGVVTLCAGGGMGAATILERV